MAFVPSILFSCATQPAGQMPLGADPQGRELYRH
jgi:hypothetical protein